MDMDSYEETRLGKDDWAKYLKEGAICYLVFYNGQVRQQSVYLFCLWSTVHHHNAAHTAPAALQLL